METHHVEEQLPPFEISANPFEDAEASRDIQPEPQANPRRAPERAHGKNYRWLVGTLQRVHTPKHQWKLRYADIDQHDEWGGSMILAPDARLDEWHDGDLVYVEGEILTARPSLYLTGPLYRLHIIRPATELAQVIPRSVR